MGKSEAGDAKKAEKKAKKRAKKEEKKRLKEAKRAAKEAKKLKKEKKRKEKKPKREENIGNGTSAEVGISAYLARLPQSEHLDKKVFQRKKMELTVSVLPAALANITESLEDSVRQMLMKYQKNVGVLLEFENLRRKGNSGHGKILGELPYLHYEVSFDGLVFSPEIGSKLQGRVTESFPSHVGILVLDYINAMIPARGLQSAGYRYENESQQWTLEDGSKFFSNGQTINFVVEKVHECAGAISLEGTKPS